MAEAKARLKAKPKPRDKKPKLVAINIRQARKIIRTLRKHEKDREMQDLIDCLDWVFENAYGGVVVCQVKAPLGPGQKQPCCGMC